MGENPRFWVVFSLWFAAIAVGCVMLLYHVTAAHAATEPTPTVPQVIDIQNDPGGDMMERYKAYQEISKEGTVIRLHGYCASACTLVLLREFTGIKACATTDAIFAFHKPYMLDKRQKIVKTKKAIRDTRAVWAQWMAHFPYDVYNLLKDARIPSVTEGDSQNDMFIVPAIFFVPACGAAQ